MNLARIFLLSFAIPLWAQEGIIKTETKLVTCETGQTVDVLAGRLNVPENRKNTATKTLSIPYILLKSPQPQTKAAIFMLAGGPGSSGIEQMEGAERFKEITFYQTFADVVVFDQRGAGGSLPSLQCSGSEGLKLDGPITAAMAKDHLRKMGQVCKDELLAQGIDLSAYNTAESAHDVNDLRLALGYEHILLVGGSYGSHLGLHLLRTYPDAIKRAMFYGIEGPDHTFDRPDQLWNTLQRIASELEQSDYYRTRLTPNELLAALTEVITRLRQKPVEVKFKRGDQTHQVWVNDFAVQMVAAWRAGKRSHPTDWPELLLAMQQGDYELPARAIASLGDMNAFNGMKYLMDGASSLSAKREHEILSNEKTALLGQSDFDLWAMSSVWSESLLPDSFRQPVHSEIPVLLIHGTWDTATPIENAHEVLSTLSEGALIEVRGGNHGALYNLFEHWAPMNNLVKKFLLGESVDIPKFVELGPLTFPTNAAAQEQLWDAARSGEVKTAEAAIEAGADLHALDTRGSKSGRRALNWAALHNHVDVLKLLVARGADLNSFNLTGYTAFHHAIENGSVEAARFLLEAGCDPHLPNKKGQTPLQTAKRGKATPILVLFAR